MNDHTELQDRAQAVMLAERPWLDNPTLARLALALVKRAEKGARRTGKPVSETFAIVLANEVASIRAEHAKNRARYEAAARSPRSRISPGLMAAVMLAATCPGPYRP